MGLYRTIVVETIGGKSIGRTLFNYELRFHSVEGRVLDLGSGRVRPSYYRFLTMKDCSVITVNISIDNRPDVLADLERPFPFRDECFEAVLLFNLLEHLYNYRNALEESHRVLKSGGKLYGMVPFLMHVHGDPYDHFRYTETAMLRLLKEAGFKHINIRALGLGPFLAGYSQIQLRVPRMVRPLSIFLSIAIDKLMLKVFSIDKDKYPLGYLFICEKGV